MSRRWRAEACAYALLRNRGGDAANFAPNAVAANATALLCRAAPANYFISGFRSPHALIGVIIIVVLGARVARGAFGPQRYTTPGADRALLVPGRHRVWIFVCPLSYLVGRSGMSAGSPAHVAPVRGYMCVLAALLCLLAASAASALLSLGPFPARAGETARVVERAALCRLVRMRCGTLVLG